jgi:hypothetical protein
MSQVSAFASAGSPILIMENNCYTCTYRGNVPGDAHSCCKHPCLEGLTNDPIKAMFTFLDSKSIIISAIHKLKIQAIPHGIIRGWFNWPINFDPVWLTNCNGFEQKI